jgi:nucleoid-associated protein YgaU
MLKFIWALVLGLGIPLAFIGCASAQKVVDKVVPVVRAVATVVEDVEKVENAITSTPREGRYGRHTVVKGETLWAISRQKYKTGFLWPLLCDLNGLQNCHLIQVGYSIKHATPDLLATYSADELNQARQRAYAAR